MPAINANIVVEQTTLTLSPTTTQIGVTVDPINLGIFTTSPTPIGGNIGQLQYNVNGAQFGGVANTSVASGNLTFTNLANLKIDGGTNAYYLQTDGAGGLTWAAGGTPTGSGVPSGANTQIQLSDGSGSFASGAGFTFDNASNVFSTPGRAIVAGNIDTTAGIFNGDGYGLSNIASANIIGLNVAQIANGTSNVDIATIDGNIEFAVGGANIVRMSTTGLPYPALVKIEGNVTTEGDITINPGAIFIGDGGGLSNIAGPNIVGSFSNIANGTSNVSIAAVDGDVVVGVGGSANVASFFTGGANVSGDLNVVSDITSTAGLFTGDGGGLSNVTAVTAGTVSSAAQPNITSIGTLTSLNVAGTTTIQQAKEKVVQDATAATGTVDYDLLTSAIILQTTDALADFTLNVRGNATTTLDLVMSTDESMTLSFINQNGATAYIMSNITIDGTAPTIKWIAPGNAGAGTINGNDFYTLNIIKTASSTFKVYASRVGYS